MLGGHVVVHEEGSRRWAIVLDGEIYDAGDLRRTLEARGHAFSTGEDAELIAHAYVEWGDECTQHFDGVYAFAIWDEARRRLLLARDPLGVRPLYWARRGTSLVFGSEIKCVLEHPDVETVLSREGLGEIAVAPPRLVATPGLTPFRDVRELRPGRRLAFEDGAVREHVFWQLTSKPHTDDIDTTVRRVAELFRRSVERRLAGNPAPAFLLSGGVDSSALIAVGSPVLQNAHRDVSAWSIDFVDGESHFASIPMMPSRDAPFAAMMAARFAKSHRVVMIDNGALVDRLLDAMRAHDLPTASQRDTSLLLLCEALAKETTVTLSGIGSDELFAGYHWWLPSDRARSTPSFPWIPPIPREAPWPLLLAPALLAEARPHEYLASRYEEARSEVPRLKGEDDANARDREASYMTLTRRLPYMLERSDRISGAAGVEERIPFCDPALVQYMWNVPQSIKQIDGYEKGLLRRALAGVVPDEILSRKKSAFPATQDRGYAMGLAARLEPILTENKGGIGDLVDSKRALALISDREALGNPDLEASLALEYVLQLDSWVREYRVRLP